jgi:hypothetical protein
MAGVVPADVTTDPYITCTYQIGRATQVKPCTPTIFKNDTHTLIRFDVSVNFNFVNPLTGRETGLLISTGAPVHYLGN